MKKADNNLNILFIYRYRVIWVVSSLLIAGSAYHCSPTILQQCPKPIDVFNYWGTVATITALIITILEIIQSAKIAKSIALSIDEKVSLITTINKTALLAESSGLIDQIVDGIDADQYSEATILIRELQKKLLYSQADLLQNEIDYQGEKINFASLEHKIEAYRASNTSALVTKRQKSFVKGALINLKQKINDNNPGRK
jgi:hypothetical protein